MTESLFEDYEIRPVVHSVSTSQDFILNGIIRLHIPCGRFVIDGTFNTGAFYKSGSVPLPDFRYDIDPRAPEVEKHDCRDLPHKKNSVESIILDPPFLLYKGKKGSKLWSRYSGFKSRSALFEMYRDSIREAYRVLKRKGVLVFKCQDGVYGNRFDCRSVDAVYLPALKVGFRPVDLFILECRKRQVSVAQAKNQCHARGNHCYFWVFGK